MTIIKRTGRITWGALLLFVIGFVIYLNYGLYYAPRFARVEKDDVNTDLLAQLRFLKVSMHKDAPDKMQQYYPEGFVFMHALYSLSWCEMLKYIDKDSELYKEGHREIQYSYNEINSEKGKAVFQRGLQLPYGAFYTGWKNYVLGKKISVEKPADRDSTEVKAFEAGCAGIAEAITDSSASPYPETYKGMAWPADVSVAIACLANHDRIFKPKYAAAIQLWISKVRPFLDQDGLMPYGFDPLTLQAKGEARGSSQSLIQNFLFEIDSSFCREQFSIYKKLFLDSRAGLPGIREYRKGSKGKADVDSAPVILDIGGPASIVGLRIMSLMQENETAVGLRNSIETFGFSTESNGEKKYLLGKLPMADAFICWANATELNAATKRSTGKPWRMKFQLYSLLVLLSALLLLLRLVGVKFYSGKKRTPPHPNQDTLH